MEWVHFFVTSCVLSLGKSAGIQFDKIYPYIDPAGRSSHELPMDLCVLLSSSSSYSSLCDPVLREMCVQVGQRILSCRPVSYFPTAQGPRDYIIDDFDEQISSMQYRQL